MPSPFPWKMKDLTLPSRLNGLGGARAERTARRIREPLWEVSLGTCNFPVSPSSFSVPFPWRFSGDKCISSAGLGGFCSWCLQDLGLSAEIKGGNVQMGKSLPSMMGAFKYWEFTAGSAETMFFVLIIAY